MIRTTSIALIAAAALVAGCGEDGNDASGAAEMNDRNAQTEAERDATGSEAAMPVKPKGKVVKVVESQFGRVIADGTGEAFYLFDKEQTRKAECYGECATAWPPVLTKGKPRAGKGVEAAKLGTTRRRDGKLQVTYAGHPLYYYVDDAPGTILCQNVDEFGGLWLVVKPSGQPVR
jgi:predicted lipoprotein with Yx(FWY)xxD motif